MKTNQSILVAHPARQESAAKALSNWLNQRNELFSSLMEETITQRQVLLIMNFVIALVVTVIAVVNSSFWGLCSLAYLVSAYQLLKKGGMLYV